METTTTSAPAAHRTRRLLQGTAFVAVWIALGYLLPVDANAYLLLGVPLTAAFQLIGRCRPLRELWVRDGTPFRLDRCGLVLAALLAVTPVIALVQAVAAEGPVATAWTVCAVAGAVPAAYALRLRPVLGRRCAPRCRRR